MKVKSLEGITILTNEQINPEFAVEIERQVFLEEPPETIEALKKMRDIGFLLGINEPNIKAITQLARLDNLLIIDQNSLPVESPLRMVLENERRYQVLSLTATRYGKEPRQVIYSHGIGVIPQGQGYGTQLHKERLKRFVGEDDILIGFVMAQPLNVPSLRMHLRHGAVIDKIETDVYEHGKPYFRVVYNAKIKTDSRFVQEGIILVGDYLKQIYYSLERGCVGVRFETPSCLFFKKRA